MLQFSLDHCNAISFPLLFTWYPHCFHRGVNTGWVGADISFHPFFRSLNYRIIVLKQLFIIQPGGLFGLCIERCSPITSKKLPVLWMLFPSWFSLVFVKSMAFKWLSSVSCRSHLCASASWASWLMQCSLHKHSVVRLFHIKLHWSLKRVLTSRLHCS